MAAKCGACSYEMSTWQEISTILWVIIKIIPRKVVAGPLNVEKVKCPKCGEIGRWVDK